MLATYLSQSAKKYDAGYIAPVRDEYVSHMISNIYHQPNWARAVYNGLAGHQIATATKAYEFSPTLFYYFLAVGIPDVSIDMTIDAILSRDITINTSYAGDAYATAAIVCRDIGDIIGHRAGGYPTRIRPEYSMTLNHGIAAKFLILPPTSTITRPYYRVGFLCRDDDLVMTKYCDACTTRPITRQVELDMKIAIYLYRPQLLRRMLTYEKGKRYSIIQLIDRFAEDIVTQDYPEFFDIIRPFFDGNTSSEWCDNQLMSLAVKNSSVRTIDYISKRLPIWRSLNRFDFSPEAAIPFFKNNPDGIPSYVYSLFGPRKKKVAPSLLIPIVRFINNLGYEKEKHKEILNSIYNNISPDDRIIVLMGTTPGILIDEGVYPIKTAVDPWLTPTRSMVTFEDITIIFEF